MRWRTNKDGDMRERIIFAWLPIPCEDGHTRWMTRVRVVEKWGRWGYDPETSHWGWNVLKAYPADVDGKRVRL
jgi:hypothetical protein